MSVFSFKMRDNEVTSWIDIMRIPTEIIGDDDHYWLSLYGVHLLHGCSFELGIEECRANDIFSFFD